MHQSGLLKVIKLFGSQKALAKALGVKQQAFSHWLNRDQRFPTFKSLK